MMSAVVMRNIVIGGVEIAVVLFAIYAFVDAVGWHLFSRACRRENLSARTIFRVALRAERKKARP